MIAFLWLALYALAFFGSGRVILSRIRFRSMPEEFVFSSAVGIVLFSVFAMIMCALKLVYKAYFIFFAVVMLLAGAGRIRSFLRAAADVSRRNKRKLLRPGVSNILLCFILVLAAANLMLADTPPIEWDSIRYHLADPKVYVQNHGFVNLPSEWHSNMPFFTEMIYLTGLLMQGAELAKLFACLMGLLLVLMIYSFASQRFSREVSMALAAIFISIPIISQFMSTAKNDIPLAFFAFLAVASYIFWAESSDKRWLLVSSVMAGAAAAIKTTGIAVSLIICLLIFWNFILKKEYVSAFLRPSIYFVVSFVFLAPWLIKSLIYTGNPVWPLAYSVFGGQYWNPGLAEILKYLGEYGYGTSLLDFVLLPFRITFYPNAFATIMGISPVFLMFIPLVFMYKRDKFINILLWSSFLLLVFWFVTSQQLRFIIPVLPLALIAIGKPITELDKARMTRTVAAAAIMMILMVNSALFCAVNMKKAPMAVGLEDKDKYISSYVAEYDAAMFANLNLQGSRILLAGYSRHYYFDVDYVIGDPRTQGYIDYDLLEDDPEKLFLLLKKDSITHILINKKQNYRDDKFTLSDYGAGFDGLIGRFTEKHGKLVYDESDVKIYEIV